MEYKINRAACHQAFQEHMTKLGPVALKVEQVAELLNVSPRHIYKLVQDNQIPHVKIGSAVRFDSKDISDWIGAMAAAQRSAGDKKTAGK